MERVLVVGTTGSGKTTFARRLADVLDAPHVELDGLFWEAGWVEADTDVFRARVATATVGERWVVDGNYLGRLGDQLWERADTAVWLEMPLWLIVPRLVRRTISRSVRKTDLWGSGNREKVSTLWDKDESLVAWALRVQKSHRETYGARMADPHWSHISFVHLTSRRDADGWLLTHHRSTVERSHRLD